MPNDVDSVQLQSVDKYKEDIKSLQMEIETLKEKLGKATESVDAVNHKEESLQTEEKVVEIDEDKTIVSQSDDAVAVTCSNDGQSPIKDKDVSSDLSKNYTNGDTNIENSEGQSKANFILPSEDGEPHIQFDNIDAEADNQITASSYSFSLNFHSLPLAWKKKN